MGILSKRVLGNVRGKVGDLQFRRLGDLNYIALNPESFIPGTDEASVARRSNFALAIKFGSAVNSISYLRKLWYPYTIKGSSFNLIVGQNYPYINEGNISDRAMLLPERGFAVNTTSVDLSSAELRAALEALGTGTGIDDAVERTIYLAAIVHFSNPVEEADKPHEFITLLSAPQSIDLVNPLSFSIQLDNVEGQIFNAYQGHKVFAALFTVDANDNPVNFSNTIVS
jgi:hypothetical protein